MYAPIREQDMPEGATDRRSVNYPVTLLPLKCKQIQCTLRFRLGEHGAGCHFVMHELV
jgi:hypothetical protein